MYTTETYLISIPNINNIFSSQALSQAAGIAFARKRKGHTGRVVVYMSDGEMQEGQTWEAVQALVFHKIELIAVVDVNGQQCDGLMESVCNIGSIASKLRAFGAVVREVDGHNIRDIDAALTHTHQSGPTFVLCHTDPCHGFPLLRERAPKLHYVRFKDAAEKQKWQDVLDKMPARKTIIGDGKQKKFHYDAKIVQSSSQSLTTTRLEQCTLAREVENGHHSVVTRPHRAHLLEWMIDHPKAIVLTADLTSSCEADLIRDELPNQYLSMGMAEQNMMSFAGGLAREGFRYVFCPFLNAN